LELHLFLPIPISHNCIIKDDHESLVLLVNNGAEKKDLLRLCIKNKANNCLIALIQMGIDVNEFYDSNPPPIYAAVSNGNYQFCEILLKNQADPSIIYNGKTLVSLAVKKGNIKIFRLLLDNGAPISTLGSHTPPLIVALVHNRIEMASVLLSMGAIPNENGRQKGKRMLSPLEIAIKNRSKSSLKLLLALGADSSVCQTNDDEMRRILENYPFKSPTNVHVELSERINELRSFDLRIEDYINKCCSVIDIKGDHYIHIRNSVEEVYSIIKNAVTVSHQLHKARKSLIDKRLKKIEQEEAQIFFPLYESENDKWEAFFDRVVTLIEKNRSLISEQKSNFIDFVLQEIHNKKGEFLVKHAAKVVEENEEIETSELYELIQLQLYSNVIFENIYHSIKRFDDAVNLFCTEQLKESQLICDHIKKLSQSDNQFQRIGFCSNEIRMIANDISELTSSSNIYSQIKEKQMKDIMNVLRFIKNLVLNQMK